MSSPRLGRRSHGNTALEAVPAHGTRRTGPTQRDRAPPNWAGVGRSEPSCHQLEGGHSLRQKGPHRGVGISRLGQSQSVADVFL